MIDPTKATTKKETSIIGAAAEYYVMFQLLRRGYVAALAPKGVPDVDILVTDTGGHSLAAVQVKGRQFSKDGGWTMSVKHERIVNDQLFYCFVDFGQALTEQPKCWIIPSCIVADVLQKSHTAWLQSPGRGGRPHKDWDMRRITHSYNHETYNRPLGWLDEFRDTWDQLRPAP